MFFLPYAIFKNYVVVKKVKLVRVFTLYGTCHIVVKTNLKVNILQLFHNCTKLRDDYSLILHGTNYTATCLLDYLAVYREPGKRPFFLTDIERARNGQRRAAVVRQNRSPLSFNSFSLQLITNLQINFAVRCK